MDQLFQYTATSRFIPGQLVTFSRTWSSWQRYKLGFFAWNSFHLKGFLVIFQVAKISFPFWTKGCLLPWGSISRSGVGVISNGYCIDISNRREYQTFDETLSEFNLSDSKEWNGMRKFCSNSCYVVSIGLPCCNCGSWWQSLDAKSSTVGYPKYLIILWNMLWRSF